MRNYLKKINFYDGIIKLNEVKGKKIFIMESMEYDNDAGILG